MLPGGPRPSSVHGTSVACSLEQSVTTCTSWTEDMESNPDLDEPGNPQLRQTHAHYDTEHMTRERARNFAIESRRQARRALEQTWHASPPYPGALGIDSDVSAATLQPARQPPHPVALEHGEPSRRSAHLQDKGADWDTTLPRETSLPSIPEKQQAPSHSPESLSAIISRFNSLETMNGAVGVHLRASAIGQAYANVPISMIIFTSRPFSALLTRWPMLVFMLGFAITIFYPGIIGVRSAIRGTSIPVRWIKVHDVKVYEKIFPDLRWDRVEKDTQLPLAAAGIYDNSFDRTLIPGCNTTLGENSFEMQCTANVLMQGIWLQVVGATKRATPDDSRPFYDYAGIQYAYTIGRVQEDGAVRAERIPAEDDIYNVMGTGEKIRGSIWAVRPSQMRSDGLFQLPFAAARGGDSGRVLSGGSGSGVLVRPLIESVGYCLFGKHSEK